MLQIRHGVFETNSSSTHSITMCSKSEYEAWRNGDVYLNDGWWYDCDVDAKNKNFITKEKAIGIIGAYKYSDYTEADLHNLDEEELEEEFYDHGIYSYDSFWNRRCDWFETYSNRYTTENGDEVVAFGYYGHD